MLILIVLFLFLKPKACFYLMPKKSYSKNGRLSLQFFLVVGCEYLRDNMHKSRKVNDNIILFF